jgi:hypothetical protein
VTARLPAHRIRETIEAAVVVKAPSWSEDHRWHVVSGGTVLVVIEPAYRGITRNGWRWWIADLGPSSNRSSQPTRQAAAVAGLGAWERWAGGR